MFTTCKFNEFYCKLLDLVLTGWVKFLNRRIFYLCNPFEVCLTLDLGCVRLCVSRNLQSSKYAQHSNHVVSKRLKMQRFQRLFLESSTQQSCRIILQLALAKKKMPKRVGTSTQPCFTPFLIGKGPETEPLYWTVPCMSSWKDVIILRSLDGHPILCRRVNRPFLLIRSKALATSVKAIYSGFLYSRHFSLSATLVKRSCQLLTFLL